MTKMNWTRSFKSTALVVLLALSFAAVPTAGAISVSPGEVPTETRVGETVSTTIVVEDPFVEMNDQWTLEGETELQNVSWTITVLQQGDEVDESSYGTQSFEQDLDASNGGDTLEIQLTGDTPAVENYTYEPRETYTLYNFDTVEGNSTSNLNETQVHHYTNESKETRQTIDEAAMAVNESGNADARTSLNSSISSYNNGNFPNAQRLAEEAQNKAEQTQQSQQRTQTILYAVGGLLVLGLVGGGVYYWRSQQNDPTKLQ